MISKTFPVAAIVLTLAGSAHAGLTNFGDISFGQANTYYNATPDLTNPTFSTTTTLNGQFQSGGNSFNNSYTYYVSQAYGNGDYWSGWSMSNQTNIANPNGSINDQNFEYTSITGSGYNGSANYAIANTDGDGSTPTSIINLAPGSGPLQIQVTNTAYDYYSMEYGDEFVKNPISAGQYLSMTVYGYTGLNGTGTELSSSVTVYLANYGYGGYTGPNFILSSWESVDLSSLSKAKSLVFGMNSNIDNAYGVAVPYEFALGAIGSVPEPSSVVLCLAGIGIGSVAFRRAHSRKGSL